MEESQESEKLSRLVTCVLSASLIVLAAVLAVALVKLTYSLAMMVLNISAAVPYEVAEQTVMFFLCFGFIGLVVQYFKSGHQFPVALFYLRGDYRHVTLEP